MYHLAKFTKVDIIITFIMMNRHPTSTLNTLSSVIFCISLALEGGLMSRGFSMVSLGTCCSLSCLAAGGGFAEVWVVLLLTGFLGSGFFTTGSGFFTAGFVGFLVPDI